MERLLQIIGSFSECFWRLIFGKNWRASPRKNASLQLESSLNTRHHWGPQIFGIIICFNKDFETFLANKYMLQVTGRSTKKGVKYVIS